MENCNSRWKRTKQLKIDNDQLNLQHPLQHIPDTNYWLYSAQVNLYGYIYILETEYGMTIGGYYLAVVHPDIDRGHRGFLSQIGFRNEGYP